MEDGDFFVGHLDEFPDYPTQGTSLEDLKEHLASLYQDLLAADDLASFEVPTRFYEIGSPSGLAATREHIAARARATRETTSR